MHHGLVLGFAAMCTFRAPFKQLMGRINLSFGLRGILIPSVVIGHTIYDMRYAKYEP